MRAVLIAFLLTTATALPADELRVFSVAQLEALGRALYDQDRRASIASEMLDDHFDPEEEKINGWVIEGDVKHTVVRFIRNTEQGPVAILDAVFDDLLLPSFSRSTTPTLTPFQSSQLAAREAARPYLKDPCSRRFDNATLPDPDGTGILVYALALSDDPKEVMIGGHYRFSMSRDGKNVNRAEALSTSCVAAPRERLHGTDTEQGLAIRANLSDTPLETHVLLSLKEKVPLFVVTRDLKMWKVENGKMIVIRDKPGPLSTAQH